MKKILILLIVSNVLIINCSHKKKGILFPFLTLLNQNASASTSGTKSETSAGTATASNGGAVVIVDNTGSGSNTSPNNGSNSSSNPSSNSQSYSSGNSSSRDSVSPTGSGSNNNSNSGSDTNASAADSNSGNDTSANTNVGNSGSNTGPSPGSGSNDSSGSSASGSSSNSGSDTSASTNVGSSGSDTGPSPGSGSNDSSGSSTGGSTNISAGGSNSGSDTNTNVGGNSDTGSGSNVGSGSSARNDTSTTGSAGTDAGSSSGSSVTPTQKITGVITVNDQIGSIPFTYNTVQTIPLNLIVTDKQSKPISGATVIVSDNEGHILFQGISNSMGKVSGSITVETALGQITLEITAGGESISNIINLINVVGINREIKYEILLPVVAVPVDSDKDGVPDTLDTYPQDPTRSALIRTPTEGVSTVAYEDLYPSAGDADLNDYVLHIHNEEDLNTAGDVIRLRGTYQHVARGAEYKHTFFLKLPVSTFSA